MNFRAKIIAMVTAASAAALGSTFLAVSYAFNHNQQDHLDQELLAVALSEASEAPRLGFSFSDRPGPAANDVGPLTKHGIIYDESGGVLATTPLFQAAPPARSEFSAPLGAGFDFYHRRRHLRGVMVTVPQHPGKVVLLAAPRADLDGDERFLHRAMLIGFGASVGWAALLALWSTRRLTGDHARIAAVARQVASGDLSARVGQDAADPDVVQLSRDIDDMIETINALMISQQRFIAHAAHELRSPLAKLLGELQQALRKERDVDAYRRSIREALDATQRLKRLTEDMLTLARVTVSRRDDAVTVSINAIVAEALELTAAQRAERKLRTKVEGADVLLRGEPNDLLRLVRNIIENAASHSPEGGLISARWRVEGALLHLDVADDGEGVSEQLRAKIFEPFFRAPPSQPRPGAGLGLGIAREIARAHGGDVTLLASEKGALFRISLPIAR